MYTRLTVLLLMVMPRSRSMSIESRIWSRKSRSSTAPQRWIRRSARVDLPWSMWAMMQKLRVFSKLVLSAETMNHPTTFRGEDEFRDLTPWPPLPSPLHRPGEGEPPPKSKKRLGWAREVAPPLPGEGGRWERGSGGEVTLR